MNQKELKELQALSTMDAAWMCVRDALWSAIAERVEGTEELQKTLRAKNPDPRKFPWPPAELLKLALRDETGDQFFQRVHELAKERRRQAYAPYQTLRFKIRSFLNSMANLWIRPSWR